MRWLALAILVGGAAARADEPPEVEAARGHFQAGRVYFDRGDYRRALVEFREAARDADRPELDYNLGRTCEQLGDAVAAVGHFRRYLERRPDAEDRADVERAIAALEGRIGVLAIESRVAGAAFRVDGEPVALAPGGRMRLTAGEHEVVAARDGFHSATARVRVAPGLVAHLAIDPTPPPTRWWIGVVVGVAAAAAVAAILAVAFGVQTAPGTAGNFPPRLQVVP